MCYEELTERFKPKYYDKGGNRLSLDEWGSKFEDQDYKIVKQERIGDYFISTVWVGLDMFTGNMFGGGPDFGIHIFESMVFDKENEGIEQMRYATLVQAQHGHEEFVERYKEIISREIPSVAESNCE